MLRVPRFTWALLCLPATLPAQATPPPHDAASDQPVELSPFIVSSEEDTGYAATSTLAGSRLRTDLRDVAASVTVLTKELMDDLAVNDIASAMEFSVGAENDATADPTGTNSLNQGFVGGDFGDVNTRSGEVRFRGLGRATSAINYIQSPGSTDRYNSESAEVLRGANSILFGLAEPAGLVNSRTKMANIQRKRFSVETRLDNFGSVRAMLDANLVLVKNVLAVRAVALDSETRYKVRTAYQDDGRVFAAGTYKPFKYTIVRAFFENVEVAGRRPNYRSVQDNVSGWLALYNQYYNQLTPDQRAAAFYNDPIASPTTPADSTITVGNQTIALGTIRRYLDGGSNRTALVYDGTNWNEPMFGGAILLGGRTPGGGTPAVPFRGAFARSASPLENRTGYTDPRVNDTAMFPFLTQELTAVPGNFRREKDRKYNLTIDQRILPDLYVSATFQREDWRQHYYVSPIAQTQQLSIDINTRLPDGRANPNFLRPFVYGRSLGRYEEETDENLLLQANYDFDFARQTRFGWLGFHRLTGMYTRTNVDQFQYSYNLQFTNPRVPGVFDVPETNAARNAYQVWYIGDAVQPGDTTIRYTGLPSTTTADADRSFGYTYLNPANQWVYAPNALTVSNDVLANNRNYFLRKNSGVGLSLQSFFWKRRIVTLFGMRRDKVEAVTRKRYPDPDNYLLGASRSDYDSATEPQLSNQKDTMTQSIVFHVTPTLRLLANRSENFAATTPRTDNFYRPLAPQSGETTEVGIGATLLNDKLNLRGTYYKSSQKNATSGGAASTASLRVEAFEDRLYNALESAGRLAEWTTFGPNGPTTQPYAAPQDVSATEDRVAKGWELEAIYNPTRSWRLAASLGKTDSVSTNVGRELGEFLAARAPFYRKYFTEGLRRDGTNARTIPQTSSMLMSDDFLSTVASNYVANKNNEGTSNRGVPEYTATLVTSYTFRYGRLRGFGLGANVRWENGKIYGYPQVDNVYAVGGLDNVSGTVADVKHPYVSHSIYSGGMFMKYSRRIFHDRVAWRVQLNAQNLFSEHGLRVIAVQPDGGPVYGVARPLTVQLTNAFDF